MENVDRQGPLSYVRESGLRFWQKNHEEKQKAKRDQVTEDACQDSLCGV